MEPRVLKPFLSHILDKQFRSRSSVFTFPPFYQKLPAMQMPMLNQREPVMQCTRCSVPVHPSCCVPLPRVENNNNGVGWLCPPCNSFADAAGLWRAERREYVCCELCVQLGGAMIPLFSIPEPSGTNVDVRNQFPVFHVLDRHQVGPFRARRVCPGQSSHAHFGQQARQLYCRDAGTCQGILERAVAAAAGTVSPLPFARAGQDVRAR